MGLVILKWKTSSTYHLEGTKREGQPQHQDLRLLCSIARAYAWPQSPKTSGSYIGDLGKGRKPAFVENVLATVCAVVSIEA